MMDDNRFEEMIAKAARELDPPPAAPREAMWAAISAARQDEAALKAAAAAATASEAAPAAVIPIGAARSASLPSARSRGYDAMLRYGMPLAAMLVIGVGLGRLTMRSRNAGAPSASQQTVAAGPGTQTPATTVDGASKAERTAIDSADARNLAALNREPITAVTPDRSAPGLARSVKRSNAPASNGRIVREGSGTADTRTAAAPLYDNAVLYRAAASRHFIRAQTLLVSLSNDAREGRINEIAVRAADLLVNTRLLLDSPAAKDPELHRLLDDLELILAQVATISPTKSAEDVDMIQNAITKRDVLLRLHAVTTGPRLSGT